MSVRIFRWKAIGPLLLFFALLGILVWIFAEPVAKDTTEEASTELRGLRSTWASWTSSPATPPSVSARSRSPTPSS